MEETHKGEHPPRQKREKFVVERNVVSSSSSNSSNSSSIDINNSCGDMQRFKKPRIDSEMKKKQQQQKPDDDDDDDDQPSGASFEDNRRNKYLAIYEMGQKTERDSSTHIPSLHLQWLLGDYPQPNVFVVKFAMTRERFLQRLVDLKPPMKVRFVNNMARALCRIEEMGQQKNGSIIRWSLGLKISSRIKSQDCF